MNPEADESGVQALLDRFVCTSQRLASAVPHYEAQLQDNDNQKKVVDEARFQQTLALRVTAGQLAQLDHAMDVTFDERAKQVALLLSKAEGLSAKALAARARREAAALAAFSEELPFQQLPRSYCPAQFRGAGA